MRVIVLQSTVTKSKISVRRLSDALGECGQTVQLDALRDEVGQDDSS